MLAGPRRPVLTPAISAGGTAWGAGDVSPASNCTITSLPAHAGELDQHRAFCTALAGFRCGMIKFPAAPGVRGLRDAWSRCLVSAAGTHRPGRCRQRGGEHDMRTAGRDRRARHDQGAGRAARDDDARRPPCLARRGGPGRASRLILAGSPGPLPRQPARVRCGLANREVHRSGRLSVRDQQASPDCFRGQDAEKVEIG